VPNLPRCFNDVSAFRFGVFSAKSSTGVPERAVFASVGVERLRGLFQRFRVSPLFPELCELCVLCGSAVFGFSPRGIVPFTKRLPVPTLAFVLSDL